MRFEVILDYEADEPEENYFKSLRDAIRDGVECSYGSVKVISIERIWDDV